MRGLREEVDLRRFGRLPRRPGGPPRLLSPGLPSLGPDALHDQQLSQFQYELRVRDSRGQLPGLIRQRPAGMEPEPGPGSGPGPAVPRQRRPSPAGTLPGPGPLRPEWSETSAVTVPLAPVGGDGAATAAATETAGDRKILAELGELRRVVEVLARRAREPLAPALAGAMPRSDGRM
jgi:hypothetical protein